MVFITDIFYYGHLSCLKTSLLRTLLWKPLYYGRLSTSSTHTSGMDMSLLRTPLSLYCKHPLIADVAGMEMSLLRTLPITDNTHSLQTPLVWICLYYGHLSYVLFYYALYYGQLCCVDSSIIP